jgi:alkylation response protein AidB-like acyl-CoA dehydrogenase
VPGGCRRWATGDGKIVFAITEPDAGSNTHRLSTTAVRDGEDAAAEAALAAVDAAIQCHGGNGVSTEYGLIPLWGPARLLRIAPVNREMILNYVAQHSLGLPRSY